CVQTMAFPFTF
nr:immunoglobulin light chain junction region [Macaca mulatta]